MFEHETRKKIRCFAIPQYLEKAKITNINILLPGESWSTHEVRKASLEKWKDFKFSNRQSYLKTYQQTRLSNIQEIYDNHPFPSVSMWEQFKAYFLELLTMSPYFNEKINMRVGFEIQGPGGGDWHVDFREGQQGVGKGLEDCGYIYSFESRWLEPILNEEVPWEDFFLSLRFKARRNPDQYNDHLLGLLKFADRVALEEVQKFETTPKSDEMITVHSDGKTYSVSRYCPHAGNDLLKTGEVLPGGIFRCLAHHYDFDLNTGECITSVCDALKVKRLD